MKLRNKKTGEIIDIYKGEITLHYDQGRKTIHFKHLEDLDEWEDYEEPKEYWYYDTTKNGVDKITHLEDKEKDQAIGNYFETREEAEKAVEKLKAWKRLKDKGVVFDGCFDRFGETHNHRDVVVFLLRAEAPDGGEKLNDKIEDDLDLLFGGEDGN